MIPRERKRLAEGDFPVAVVSKHLAWEDPIRHGCLSTMQDGLLTGDANG